MGPALWEFWIIAIFPRDVVIIQILSPSLGNDSPRVASGSEVGDALNSLLGAISCPAEVQVQPYSHCLQPGVDPGFEGRGSSCSLRTFFKKNNAKSHVQNAPKPLGGALPMRSPHPWSLQSGVLSAAASL